MKIYFNTSTGNYYTEDEIRNDFNMFGYEANPDIDICFSDYLGILITNGDLEELDENPFAASLVDSGSYQAAVDLMDDDIREELHATLCPCSEKEFLTAYMHAHHNKHNEWFTI